MTRKFAYTVKADWPTTKSIVVARVASGVRPLGVVVLRSTKKGRFNDREQTLTTVVGDALGVVLDWAASPEARSDTPNAASSNTHSTVSPAGTSVTEASAGDDPSSGAGAALKQEGGDQ
jgi:hypothetical protein